MLEIELRLPVARWMLARQLTPTMECYCFRNCDMVGVQWDEKKVKHIAAVELKLTNVAAVLRQCKHHHHKASEVWAAMLKCSLRMQEKFKEARVGLLLYDEGEMREIIQPAVHEHPDHILNRHRQTLWRRRKEYLNRMTRPRMTKW
jgi:hypothetical protein